MAAFANTGIARAPAASRIAAAAAAIRDAYARYKTYRTTVNELESLTSRELADLGLHRSMIKSTAMEAAYGLK